MKKLFLLLAACMLTAAATAQKITQKDLQGTWKLASFSVSGLSLDVATENITFSKEMQAKYPGEALEQIKLSMLESVEGFKTARTYVEGSTIRQVVGPDEDKGTFTITDKGTEQFIVISNPEGIAAEMQIFFKDKQLHIIQKDEEQEVDFAYIK